uniref:Protein kinase domain-containing protein n=1 Tax=viral metagenome TaxID=1070528 RepID=A0A6C0E116_9ZZZZ
MHTHNFNFTCHLKSALYVHTLGKGMFASIKLYQCKDDHKDGHMESCNKLYVVKKLKFNNIKKTYNEQVTSKDPDADNIIEKLFRDEYEIGSILNHKNIIKTYGIDTLKHSLLLEHCPGVDLFDYLNNNKYIKNKKLLVRFASLYEQVLSAVQYLHTHSIAHRDIKLENIMYDKHNHSIKLIDFGNAEYYKVDGVNVKSNKMKGTIEYLPPEVYNVLEYETDKIDIWSCGVVLFNLVYNDSPWKKAKISDSRYYACQTYFRKKDLHPFVFRCPTQSGYNIHDAQVIKDIFVTIFSAEDIEHRPDIDMLCHMYSKLQELGLPKKGSNS